MKKHLLLIGFSCTGKTSLARRAFERAEIVDSDDEICKGIGKQNRRKFSHIFEIYMALGRQAANNLIERSEESLIVDWAADTSYRVISLGPGFPLRRNWQSLRKVSCVILYHRSAEGIYTSLVERRKQVFEECPKAKEHDNWDVGVIVDERRQEYTRETAVANIERILCERERFYSDCDERLCTDDREAATKALLAIKVKLDGNVTRRL